MEAEEQVEDGERDPAGKKFGAVAGAWTAGLIVAACAAPSGCGHEAPPKSIDAQQRVDLRVHREIAVTIKVDE